MSLPTQSEYNSTIQRMRDMSIKVNVLNSSLQQIGSMTGVVIGMPSFSINADSDIRRTCNVTLTPINSSFEVGVGNLDVQIARNEIGGYLKLAIYSNGNWNYIGGNISVFLEDGTIINLESFGD